MTTRPRVGCHFRRDCTDYPWTGETPDAGTESAPVTGCECATMETYSQACETPATRQTSGGVATTRCLKEMHRDSE